MDTETKAVRDGMEEPDLRVDGQVWTVACDLDATRKAQPNWLWHDCDCGCTSYGRWPRVAASAPYVRADIALGMAARAVPSAAGCGEMPGALTLHVSRGKAGLWYVTSPNRPGLLVAEPTWDAAWLAVPGALADLDAASPSQGSDTGEAGREPRAYGIPGMPANLSNSDNLRLFSVHHADRLPKAAQDDLCRLADEWDEEVEAACFPAPPPTAPQGADLAGLSAALDAIDVHAEAQRYEFRDPDYTPADHERVMLEDFGNHLLSALTDRVLALAHPGSVAPTPGERGCWSQDMAAAPAGEEIEVGAGRMTFLAKLILNGSLTTEGEPCDQWQATRQGEHPPCWSDGCCWASNEDETASLQPDRWRCVASSPTATQDPDHAGGEAR